MVALQRNPDWMNSVNFRYDTPAGTAYIQIWEKSAGKIERVILSVGKNGSPLHSMGQGISALVTSNLLKGDSISDIIAVLSGIKTDKNFKVKGMDISSPIDALLIALIQYRASIPDELEHESKLSRYLSRVR